MQFHLLAGILILLTLTQCKTQQSSQFIIEDNTPFGVCYIKLTPDQVKNYEMVIIEPDFYSREEITALRETGTKIISYISLGEVDSNRWYFPLMEGLKFLGKNENWNSFYLDLENEKIRHIILNQVIPEIIAKGSDGLFLDTIDAVSPETERGYLSSYMVELIEKMRAQYPSIILIQNAGLFLLDQTKDDIDAFLTEALASDYDFQANEYKIRPVEEFNQRLQYLEQYSQQSGRPYFILDFADTEENKNEIASRLDTVNRPYFISNIGLSTLPVQPNSFANSMKPLEP